MSDSETDKDDNFNIEDNDDNFINHEDDEDDDSNDDDDELDIDNFYIEMKGDLTYSPRSRALCEWNLEYWHGFYVWKGVMLILFILGRLRNQTL